MAMMRTQGTSGTMLKADEPVTNVLTVDGALGTRTLFNSHVMVYNLHFIDPYIYIAACSLYA